MIRKEIVFVTREPLQRREAAMLVQAASRFESRLMIEHDSKVINAKSMLGLLSLGPMTDGKVYLVADGEDEQKAVETLIQMARNDFHA